MRRGEIILAKKLRASIMCEKVLRRMLLTHLEKIKYIMKAQGTSLKYVALHTGLSYDRLWRALHGGKGLNASDNAAIDRLYSKVKAFENE